MNVESKLRPHHFKIKKQTIEERRHRSYLKIFLLLHLENKCTNSNGSFYKLTINTFVYATLMLTFNMHSHTCSNEIF